MGTTAAKRRNGTAPESAAAETDAAPAVESAAPESTDAAPESAPVESTAPESAPETDAAPVVDIAAAVEEEDISKSARIYVQVDGVGRVPMPSGALATVQREKRADGTLGEYLLAEIRLPKEKGGPESVQRFSVARIQALKLALESVGVPTLR